MLGINLKHSLVTVAIAAGLLAAAGSASAGTHSRTSSRTLSLLARSDSAARATP